MSELQIFRGSISKPVKAKTPRIDLKFTQNGWLIKIIGFFVAMAMPYAGIAPFGMSFLAQERKISFSAVGSFIAVSLGAVAVCDRLGSAKYVSAGIIYLAVLFVLERGVQMNDFTAGLAAGGAVFLAGLVTLFWEGFTFSQFLLLACETAAVVAGALVFEKSGKLLKSGKFLPEKLGSEEKLSLGAVVAIAILSLQDIYIGSEFSVMNTVAAVALLTVAAGCGMGYSTGAGVILGLVCGIGSDYFMPIMGAFSFCGFLAGIFSRFGKGGVIAGVILANAMLVVYTDGAMESVLTLYEIMAASVVFAFVKPQIIGVVGEIICLDAAEKAGIMRMKENLRQRLKAVAESFETMAKTINRQVKDNQRRENRADLATFFDMAADKICKKCKKTDVCWNKDFDATYKSLFGLMKKMNEKGQLSPDDADEDFQKRCHQLPHLVAELNHQLDIYQVKQEWMKMLEEKRKAVGQQLSDVSEILGGISDEIKSDIGMCSIASGEPEEKFKVETDFAECAASGENGDSYRFAHIGKGKYVIALSDGMGTGSGAARESRAMLELLESFLYAGFETSVAVKFINSVMLLKSDAEGFVTMDLCIIDLCTGQAEFIKTGAEPSFIMRGTGVETVKASSLPVGIIAGIDADSTYLNMKDGDVIVMVTDGIENRSSGSMWVGDFIENAVANDTDEGLADKILNHAINQNSGEVKDDMTVLSVKLKEVS